MLPFVSLKSHICHIVGAQDNSWMCEQMRVLEESVVVWLCHPDNYSLWFSTCEVTRQHKMYTREIGAIHSQSFTLMEWEIDVRLI